MEGNADRTAIAKAVPHLFARYLDKPLMKTSFVKSKYWANNFVTFCCPISPAFDFKYSSICMINSLSDLV